MKYEYLAYRITNSKGEFLVACYSAGEQTEWSANPRSAYEFSGTREGNAYGHQIAANIRKNGGIECNLDLYRIIPGGQVQKEEDTSTEPDSGYDEYPEGGSHR